MLCAICKQQIPENGQHRDHAASELNIVRAMVDDLAGIQTAVAFLYIWSTARRDGA